MQMILARACGKDGRFIEVVETDDDEWSVVWGRDDTEVAGRASLDDYKLRSAKIVAPGHFRLEFVADVVQDIDVHYSADSIMDFMNIVQLITIRLKRQHSTSLVPDSIDQECSPDQLVPAVANRTALVIDQTSNSACTLVLSPFRNPVTFASIGGTLLTIKQGAMCQLLWSDDRLILQSERTEYRASLDSVLDVQIDGGVQESGGGFIGGGFDLVGAAIGILSASLLNSLTTKREIHTTLHLITDEGEQFLYTPQETPEQLRITLSDLFTRISIATRRKAQLQLRVPSLKQGTSTFVAELEQLTNMHKSGSLSDSEFESAKNRLLTS